MKKIFWMLVGVFAGMELKKQIDNNPNAKALVADASTRAREIGDIATEAFLDRTAELTGKPRVAKKPATKTGAAKVSTPKKAQVKKAPAKKTATKKPAAAQAAPKEASPKKSTAAQASAE